VLRMYRRNGAAMLPRLRGMFAFAIWDGRTRPLFLARDPYGIQPLYYANTNGPVRIASQVKAILAGGGVPTTRDPAGIVGFFLRGSVPEPFTMYAAIRALPAGTWMTVTPSGPSEPQQYFSIASILRDAVESHRNYSAQERRQIIADAVTESVRYHLVSDVPVGAFLSSGRDSSTIVALAADSGGTCELPQPGETASAGGVTIVGLTTLPSTMPYHASMLYSRNVQALLLHLAPDGELALDWSDEITSGACVAGRQEGAAA